MTDAANSAPAAKPSMSMDIRLRLSVMMFLQFAVWGAWFMVLGNYLGSLGFTGTQIGACYGTMALGAIVSMMFAGQVVDRYLSSEYVMAGAHLIGAVLLFAMSRIKDPTGFYIVTLAYALVYNPTLTVSNSIAFSNIPDSTRDFPTLRVLGTIGWIAAGMFVGMVMGAESGPGADLTKTLFGESLGAKVVNSNQPLILAAGLSLVLGVFSFLLPHTPPTGKPGESLPFLRAVGLLKDPGFAVFFGVSFAITIALAFYYAFTGPFLVARGVKDISSTMTIGQWSEIGFMLALPFALKQLGMKWVLVVGMGAWAVRYFIFSAEQPAVDLHFGDFSIPLWVLIGVALHGICFDFFLAAGFIHTDNKSPKDIRGSAQALFSFLTYGVGMFIGNTVSGFVVDANTTANAAGVKTVNWQGIWIVPAIGATVCLVAFIVLFRDSGKTAEEEAAPIPTKPDGKA